MCTNWKLKFRIGVTKPLFDLIGGDVSFKIWFMKGGCGKFLRAA